MRRLPRGCFLPDPYRYMDNIIGVLCGSVSLSRIERAFHAIYGCACTWVCESTGMSLLFISCAVWDTVPCPLVSKAKVAIGIPLPFGLSHGTSREPFSAFSGSQSLQVFAYGQRLLGSNSDGTWYLGAREGLLELPVQPKERVHTSSLVRSDGQITASDYALSRKELFISAARPL